MPETPLPAAGGDPFGEALPPAPPPADAGPPVDLQLRPHEYELQASVGDAIRGPFDVYTLQELIYAGQLSGDEGVRPPGALHFSPLRALPEAAAILERFRQESAVVRVPPRKGAPAPPPAAAPAAAAAAEVARQVNPVRVGLLLVGVLLVVALGAVAALLATG